ncbi:HD-GYP domain-containing protein [Devosia submarina]|uniref:HD-GYP domain-containing protein n=1 Tax=Devosia submarina TaxID=1173082 RepID=UPI000D3D9670|nr:HD domain-containing phosphohydrolase [Devosia submarina]
MSSKEADVQHFPGNGALIYVTERSPFPEAIAFARSLGAKTIHIDDLSSEHLAVDPNLVVDVDLRKIDIVRRLKVLLMRRGAGCRVFLVDPHVRVTSVHAQVLGADCILARPARPVDVHSAIRQHHGVVALGSDEAAVRRSIDDGVNVLDAGFRCLLASTIFDSTGAHDASGRIADAVGSVGAAQWLATVRGYHVGTYQHCMLVTGVVSAFAVGAGMGHADVVTLTLAGMLHDIGKAAVPLPILNKASPLSESEMRVLRQHPVDGYDYLAAHSSFNAATLRSVRHHHEMLDGSGYPDGLQGAEIDDITRIVTICDIYAAMIERRAYKDPAKPAQAMAVLTAMASAGKVEGSLVKALGRIMLAAD